MGLAVAWELLNRGLAVELIDPALDQASTSDPASGSLAALGVLMAQVFHRSSGRGWRLRQQSQLLWQQWLIRLQDGEKLRKAYIAVASGFGKYAQILPQQVQEDLKQI